MSWDDNNGINSGNNNNNPWGNWGNNNSNNSNNSNTSNSKSNRNTSTNNKSLNNIDIDIPITNNNSNRRKKNNTNNNSKNSNTNSNNNEWSSISASKRQRLDPKPIDEFEVSIPSEGSMLGKRSRNGVSSEFYYSSDPRVVQQKCPYPQTDKNGMELDEDEEDTLMFNNNIKPEIRFEKGLMIDIKVVDDHGDDAWTTGTICIIDSNKGILVHIPRYNPNTRWVQRDDPNIAPPGSHHTTEGYNWNG